MPAWLSTTGQAPGAFNLRPTSLRFTSGLARDDERRASFLKPAGAPDDPGLVATGETNLWRNTGSLELQPMAHLTTRADLVVTRDLRNYDPTTPNGGAADAERGTFLGMDTGIERERLLASSITYAPEIAGWLRPRVDFASSFSLSRDPNAPLVFPTSLGLTPTPDTVRRELAVRLGNTRTITLGTGIDVAKAGAKYTAPSSLAARLAQYIQPIDVSATRGILSTYDAASDSPGLGYQLGIGSINGFRELHGGLVTRSQEQGGEGRQAKQCCFQGRRPVDFRCGPASVKRPHHNRASAWPASDVDRFSSARVVASVGLQRRLPCLLGLSGSISTSSRPAIVVGLVMPIFYG